MEKVVKGYTTVNFNLVDKEEIEFINGVVVSKENYIKAMTNFLFTEKEYISDILCKFKDYAPIELVKRIEKILFVYRVYIAYLVLTHNDGINWDLKKFYADNLIEQVVARIRIGDGIKNFGIDEKEFTKILGFYRQDDCVIIKNLYKRAQRRFLYLVEFEYLSGNAEVTLFETFDKFEGEYLNWDVDVLKKIEDELNAILDFEICSVEEYMNYPLDENNKLSSCDYNHISNFFKWDRIAVELIESIKTYFNRTMVDKNYNKSFETDWDTHDNLKRIILEATNDYEIAEKYDLNIIQKFYKRNEKLMDIFYYDTLGDLYIHLEVKEETRPFMLFNPFETKRKKIVVSAFIGGYFKPSLFGYKTMKQGWDEKALNIIRCKKGFVYE